MSNLNYDELDDLFSGGGAPAFKFEKVGDKVTGTIVDLEVRQQRDFDSGELKVWDDGKAMLEMVLTLKTALRDSDIEDDTGERRVFCRGVMLTAFKNAVRKAKVKKPEVGATVTIVHDGLGEAKRKGFNAPKLYSVEYVPAKAAQVDAMFDDDDAVEEPAAAPSIADMTPEQLAELQAMLQAKTTVSK